jgi:predicted acyl esterase
VDGWWYRETASAFEGANFSKDLKKVKIPALHISGWWDGDGIGTKLNWGAMRSLGRTNQWLSSCPRISSVYEVE